MNCPSCNYTPILKGKITDLLATVKEADANHIVARFGYCEACKHLWLLDCGHCLRREGK